MYSKPNRFLGVFADANISAILFSFIESYEKKDKVLLSQKIQVLSLTKFSKSFKLNMEMIKTSIRLITYYSLNWEKITRTYFGNDATNECVTF